MGKCESRACEKILSEMSTQGNELTSYRKKRKRFCDNSCARTEMARRARERKVDNTAVMHNFLYPQEARHGGGT